MIMTVHLMLSDVNEQTLDGECKNATAPSQNMTGNRQIKVGYVFLSLLCSSL